MKAGLVLASLVILSVVSPAQQKEELGLPELNIIKTAVLSPSYSCRSEIAVRQGYASTAFFLSKYSQKFGTPDLLFNGACSAED